VQERESVSWRFYLLLGGGIVVLVLALALKTSIGPSLYETLLAMAAVMLVILAVAGLVMFFTRAARARITASNAAFQALSTSTHLTYRRLEGAGTMRAQPYAVLTGSYRGAAVEIGLAGYHGGTPLSTTIRILDFPISQHAGQLRRLAQDNAEIDLPNTASPPGPAALSPSECRLAEMLSSIASEAKFVVFDTAGFGIYLNPRRSLLKWFTDFTDFDIETDPVRLRAVLDQALDFIDALKRSS
jgi:hypothetical protein